MENPFLSKAMVDHINDSEDEITPEEIAKRQKKEIMEQDGFTLVEADVGNANRIKTRDGHTGTTILGVSQEKAKEFFEQQQERKAQSTVKAEYTTGKEQKELIKRDFYMF